MREGAELEKRLKFNQHRTKRNRIFPEVADANEVVRWVGVFNKHALQLIRLGRRQYQRRVEVNMSDTRGVTR